MIHWALGWSTIIVFAVVGFAIRRHHVKRYEQRRKELRQRYTHLKRDNGDIRRSA